VEAAYENEPFLFFGSFTPYRVTELFFISAQKKTNEGFFR